MRARAARERLRRNRRTCLGLGPRALTLALTAAALVWWSEATACGASNWVATVAAGSTGESPATSLPAAPGSVGATCAAPTTAKTVKVTWSAVSLATSYSVYDATTSASGTYTQVASGISGTSWTSGTLTNSTNYWFKVTALIGTKWASGQSVASPESTIHSTAPFCVQP
jgi:hypothetical protein